MTLYVKRWADFQHYKDRSPPWVKLHRGLLDNRDYFLLSAESAKALPLLWLIASEADGALPDAEDLAFRLRLDRVAVEKMLAELSARKFLVAEHAEQVATPAQPKAEQWGSRHVPQKVRIEVWNRDGGCCVWCKSAENVEYDHVLPISKGGQSTAENLQLLCRACNRKKRTKVVPATPAQPAAEHAEPRDRVEGEETGKAKALSGKPLDGFEAFWIAYPNKKGKAEASKTWGRKKLAPQLPTILADIAARRKSDPDWLRGAIPHGSTYVEQQRWLDAIAPDAPSSTGNHAGPSPAITGAEAKAREAEALALMRRQQEELGYAAH